MISISSYGSETEPESDLEFDVDALKEWRKLDGSIRAQFKKQLAKQLLEPHVPSAGL